MRFLIFYVTIFIFSSVQPHQKQYIQRNENMDNNSGQGFGCLLPVDLAACSGADWTKLNLCL